MTMKRMKHPLHGFHHAYNSHDETTMRANGWVDDVPEPKLEAEPIPEEELTTPRRRGPNKPKV